MLCLECSIRGERKREILLDSKRNRESWWIFGIQKRHENYTHTNHFHQKLTTFTLELFPLQPLYFSLFFLRDANKTPATWKFASGIVDSFFCKHHVRFHVKLQRPIFLLKSIISMWTTSKKLAKHSQAKKKSKSDMMIATDIFFDVSLQAWKVSMQKHIGHLNTL